MLTALTVMQSTQEIQAIGREPVRGLSNKGTASVKGREPGMYQGRRPMLRQVGGIGARPIRVCGSPPRERIRGALADA